MAERGAHLTTTVLNKPSIFEVVAQDTLTATFKPAAKRVLQFFIARNPEKYGWLSLWFEEVYLVFNSILQSHYLSYNGGSFAETFYGLQRLYLKTGSSPGNLPRREKFMSLFFLTVFPYLRSKLEDLSIKYQLEEADGVAPQSGWQRNARQLLMKSHQAFHLFWELWTLVQYLRYLSGRSNSHSPALTLTKVALVYAEEDMNDYSFSQMWQALSSGSFRPSLPSMKTVGSVMTRGLELAAFFIQFLQWWHSEQTRTDITALPVPETPPIGEHSERFGGVCPICMNPWKVETLLSVSGLVFCYRCIRTHLIKTSTCPVTHYPATMEDLVRIYPSQS
ncbi:peroxisome assembly protein 12 [Frankliniella occidentalis]|uniref:Peroxisome assembly protein 12 n=1 Tax=Frankliniella occidentalis TaxID=133901 RepID=A0A6J1SZZ6_FRAOC|nr:peroxisome assembly protein 12 [Frankliniella occidentalis]